MISIRHERSDRERVKRLLAAGGLGVLVAAMACSSGTSSTDAVDGQSCNPGDQDGFTGGNIPVHLTVSDTAFSVGAPDSGSTQKNITVQNLSKVNLTLTNVGTKPHDFVVACLPTPNTRGCPTQSCFPAGAHIPAVQPGESATATFVAPRAEGAYTFLSDEPGDSVSSPDGGVSGLFGQFNLI